MDTAAARTVVEGMLHGIFAMLDALLGREFKYAPGVASILGDDGLASLLAENPVVLRARIQHGLGAVALLLPFDAAIAMAAAIGETAPGGEEALSAEEAAQFAEVVEPLLGGGVSHLMERFGRNVEQFEDAGLLPDGRSEAQELAAYFGFGPAWAPFTFNDGREWSGTGVLLIGQEIIDLCPKQAESEDAGSTVSKEEMSDIFGTVPAESEARGGRRAPSNLDMVLDIRLVATARLGRLEMPIGDILNLGPGSIIEMDQLVDEAVELLINDKLVARGDVVVVDEKFGLRITEIVSQQERIESLR